MPPITAMPPMADCPLPWPANATVRLGHGSGGKLTQQLLNEIFLPGFDNPWLQQAHDAVLLNISDQHTIFTTDSFVVQPLFFSGGDIGRLAVYGTVNDLAMAGARPLYLSCGFILEEGLPLETLARVVDSMQQAARETGVHLVAGDTKVVEKGKGDGLYINTSGIGVPLSERPICPQNIEPGDAILLSGDIGRHGIAVMAQREGLEFDNPLQSDCGELFSPVNSLLAAGRPLHCLRDLTRGGLATALVELAETTGYSLTLNEVAVPVSAAVQGACEMLGLDPLHVANEGRFIAFVPEAHAEDCLATLKEHVISAEACIIGRVLNENQSQVVMKTLVGSERLLDRLPGEQLPRIC